MEEVVSIKHKFINRITVRVGLVLALIGLIIGTALYYIEQKELESNKIQQFQALSHQLHANLQHSIHTLNLLSSISDVNSGISSGINSENISSKLISSQAPLNQLIEQTPWFSAIGLLVLTPKTESKGQAITWLSDKPTDIDEQTIVKQLLQLNSSMEENSNALGLLSFPQQDQTAVLPLTIVDSQLSTVSDPASSATEIKQLFVVLSRAALLLKFQQASQQAFQQVSQQKFSQNLQQHNNPVPRFNIAVDYSATTSWLKNNPEFGNVLSKNENLGQQAATQLLVLGKLNEQKSTETTTPSFFTQVSSKNVDLVFTIKLNDEKGLKPSNVFGLFWGGLLCYVLAAVWFWVYSIRLQKTIHKALKIELSNFFDLSIDLYGLINFDGSFIQVNNAWKLSLGYQRKELYAFSYFKLIHPDDLDASMVEIKTLFDSSLQMVKFENRYLTKQGEYRWFCWHAMHNKTNNNVYVTGHDITQQKQQQISMQLANDRMKLATDKLQELDGLKSMFIATMSHELRTPLNSIIGFSAVLLQGLSGDINEKQKDHLRRVNNASKHLLSMISDIIDVSKIEAERFDSINEEFDVRDIIAEVVDEMAEKANEYGLVINKDSLYSISLTTDRRRTKQVIMNLVSNAVKYSLKGEINIYASLVGKYVDISIQDHGVGISKDEFPQLFLPFSRFKRLKMERSGTGLGLYLTKKIVENILMGKIKVQSVLNEGSTFSVIIAQHRPWEEYKGSDYDETENSVNYRR